MKLSRRPSDGFTLLEVMVSVAILTMVAAMVYSTIAVTLTAQDTAQKIHEAYHSGHVAMTKMTRDLTNAFLSKHISILEQNDRKTVFLGEDDEVTFSYLGHFRWFAEEPESDQGVVSYFVKSKKLIRREKTFIDGDPEKGGTEDVLAYGVKDLEFQYWDPDQEDWVDDWKAEMDDMDPVFLDKADEKANNLAKKLTGMDQLDTFKLPPRVQIKLVLEDSEGREYPFESETLLPMKEPFNW
jgi:general secretion pathway protein J